MILNIYTNNSQRIQVALGVMVKGSGNQSAHSGFESHPCTSALWGQVDYT